MVWIILAAGLGANFIVVTLLFRRLRGDLNRQLRDIRAERNSEWILHALKDVPEEYEQAAQAANGGGFELPPVALRPVRRKKHLGLYLGGGLAALGVMLGQGVREAWRAYRGHLVGTVAGATAAATTTVTLMTVTPWQDDASRHPPPSIPTAAPTVIVPTTHTQPLPSGPIPSTAPPPATSTPGPSTSASPTPSASATTSPTPTPSLVPIAEGSRPTATPSQRASEPPPTPSEPETTTPPAPPAPPAHAPAGEPPNPPVAPAAQGAGLAHAPGLNSKACHPRGGGGRTM
jgi:hypothetical protein